MGLYPFEQHPFAPSQLGRSQIKGVSIVQAPNGKVFLVCQKPPDGREQASGRIQQLARVVCALNLSELPCVARCSTQWRA